MRFLIIPGLFAALAGCANVDVTPSKAKKAAPQLKADGVAGRMCETVNAVATGFGEKTVTRFAESNLSLVIDKAKDELSKKGAKSFSLESQAVQCEDYINFGGSIGREHKCRASVKLCGKAV